MKPFLISGRTPLINLLSIFITAGFKKGRRLVANYPFWILISIFTYFTVGGVHCGRSDLVKISFRWTLLNMMTCIFGGVFAIVAGTHVAGEGHHEEDGIDLNALYVGVVLLVSFILNTAIFIYRAGCGYQFGVFDARREIEVEFL